MYRIKFGNPTLNFIKIFDEIFDEKLDMESSKYPTHDVIENDNEFIVELELAGVKKEDIAINCENNELSIEAERNRDDNLKYNRKELYSGKFKKSFNLPDNVNTENINATLIDGILRLRIPKSVDENKKKKEIKIK